MGTYDKQVEGVSARLKAWLERTAPMSCTVQEAAQGCFGLESPNQAEQKMLGKAMQLAGWRRAKISREGKQHWSYIPPNGTSPIGRNRLLDSIE